MTLEIELVFLVLFAAVVHAGWNAVVKAASDRFLTFTTIHTVGMLFGAAAVAFVPDLGSAAWPYLLTSAVIHNVYYVFLLSAYRHGDLSQVYPIARGTAPLLVAVLAARFAGEVPSPLAIGGLALASGGIISLTFGDGLPKRGARRGIGYALGTAALISVYTIIDGLGIRQANSPWSYIVWINLLEGIPFLAWAVTVRRREAVPFARRYWKRGLVGGTLSILAYGAALYALSQGAMAFVAALRETSVIFAAVIGWRLLGEPFGPRRVAAAAVVALGIVLMEWAG